MEWKENLKEFCELYSNDMPNIANISHEVENWESMWADVPENEVPATISDTIKKVNPISFPNILTAHFSSSSCYNMHLLKTSSVLLLKTYLSITMRQKRLNGLATLYTHKDIKVDIDKAIHIYAISHKR